MNGDAEIFLCMQDIKVLPGFLNARFFCLSNAVGKQSFNFRLGKITFQFLVDATINKFSKTKVI